MADLVRRFRVHVPDSDLDDLRRRLGATRHLIQGPELGWDAGVPTSYLRELVDYSRPVKRHLASARSKVGANDDGAARVDPRDAPA